MAKTQSQLSPCPFCGSAADGPFVDTSAEREPDGPKTYYVECKNSCGAYLTGAHSTDAAVKSWNKRAKAA